MNSRRAMPNGTQVISDGLVLPNVKILLIDGKHQGSVGEFLPDGLVPTTLIYNPSVVSGPRFTSMLATTIARLYRSVAIPPPPGEVTVVGSTPAVSYSRIVKVWPNFSQNEHECALLQQQHNTGSYPTEYKVESFSPPYLTDTPVDSRLIIASSPYNITYNRAF